MTASFIVTGTDTGIGKTVFSAGLAGLLDGFYWKPVQSGLDEETDSQVVARLCALPDGRILPEVYRLTMPLSPHRSADRRTVRRLSGPARRRRASLHRTGHGTLRH